MPLLTDKCPTCGRKKTRSLRQNARYHKLLREAKHKLGAFSVEVWHEYFKDKFLPKQIIVVEGEEKFFPTSTANLPMHPPESPNWDDYTLMVESWLAERGVYLED